MVSGAVDHYGRALGALLLARLGELTPDALNVRSHHSGRERPAAIELDVPRRVGVLVVVRADAKTLRETVVGPDDLDLGVMGKRQQYI